MSQIQANLFRNYFLKKVIDFYVKLSLFRIGGELILRSIVPHFSYFSYSLQFNFTCIFHKWDHPFSTYAKFSRFAYKLKGWTQSYKMYERIKIKKNVIIRSASVNGNTENKIIGGKRKNVDKY